MTQSFKHLRRITLFVSILTAITVAYSVQHFSDGGIHSHPGISLPLDSTQDLDDAPGFSLASLSSERHQMEQVPRPIQANLAAMAQSLLPTSNTTLHNDSVMSAIVLVSAQDASVESPDPVTSVQEQPNRSPPLSTSSLNLAPATSEYISLGDEALRIEDISGAFRTYAQALEHCEGPDLPMLKFRLGLTNEAAGALSRALDYYEQVETDAQGSIWAGLATAGKTRCWAGLGRVDLVFSEALPNSLLDSSGLSPSTVKEILMTVTSVLAQSLSNLERGPDDLLQDSRLLAPVLKNHLSRQLDLAQARSTEITRGTPTTGVRITRQFEPSPKATFLSVNLEDIPVETLIRSIAETSGFRCQFTSDAVATIQDYRASAINSKIQLALVLDALCVSRDLLWYETNGVITVEAVSFSDPQSVSDFHRRMTGHFLEMAVAELSDDGSSAHHQLLLGILLSDMQQLREAAIKLESVANGAGENSVRGVAAYNLGKCLVRLGDFQQARQAFQLTADLHAADCLTLGAAQLYIARLQLESLETRAAMSAAMRATALCEGSPLESIAMELLASVYLFSENPHGANHVLMKYRSSNIDHASADRIAFLSALARFNSSIGDERKTREAQSLAEAVSHINPETGFGRFWWLLVADTFQELGFQEYAVQLCRQGLQKHCSQAVKTRLLLKLLELDQQVNIEEIASLSQVDLDVMNLRTVQESLILHTLESLLRNGQLQQTVRVGKEFVTASSQEETRRQALQILGKAFQRMGDYPSAIRCFSGKFPVPESLLGDEVDFHSKMGGSEL